MREKAAFLLFPLALGGAASKTGDEAGDEEGGDEEEDVLLRALVPWPASHSHNVTRTSATPLPVQVSSAARPYTPHDLTNTATPSLPTSSPSSSLSSSTLTATLDRRAGNTSATISSGAAKLTLHPSEHNLELCSLLQYASASCLRELESGALLSAHEKSSSSSTSSDAYLVTRAHEQQCFVYPVEAGRYVAALTLPHRLCSTLGQASVMGFLLATALRGYATDFASAAAATSAAAVPLYRPLHARLQDNAQLVQTAMHTRLKQLVHAVSEEGERHEEGSGASVQSRRLVATLRCMCHEQTCIVRTGCQVHRVLHRLVHSGLSPTAPASLAGRMTCYGMMASERHFVVAAHALWYAGHPLHTSSSSSSPCCPSRVFADYLLPLALAATLQEHHESKTRAEDKDGEARSTEVYMAMASPWQREAEAAACWGVGGYMEYVSSSAQGKDTKKSDGVLGVAVCGATGWTLAALLRPTTLAFAPAAMTLSQVTLRLNSIVHGEELRRLDVQGLGSSATAVSSPQRTVSLFSPATTGVLGRVRELFVMRRAVGRVAATQPRESCLLYLNAALVKALLDSPPRALGAALLLTPAAQNDGDDGQQVDSVDDGGVGGGSSPVYWYARRYGPRVTQLLQCVTRLARPALCTSGGAAATTTTGALPLSRCNTVFALLRRQPQEDSLLVHAVPVAAMSGKGAPSIVYIVAELQGSETVAAPVTGELFCFTTWLLAKVM